MWKQPTSYGLGPKDPDQGKKFWAGSPPLFCDVCSNDLGNVFYDMRTKMGPWGKLCTHCALNGPGVGKTGTGFGQKYQHQCDGRWLKVEG